MIETCGMVGLDLDGTTIVSWAVAGSSAMFPLFIVSSAENTIFVKHQLISSQFLLRQYPLQQREDHLTTGH